MGLLPKFLDNELFTPGVTIGHGVDHYVDNFGESMNNMFLKKPVASADTAQEAPPPSLITPTPIATDSDKKRAQRQMQATALSRKGRASTILSDDTLGSA